MMYEAAIAAFADNKSIFESQKSKARQTIKQNQHDETRSNKISL